MGSWHITLLQPKGGTLYWHATTHGQLSYLSPTAQGGYTILTCHYSRAVVISLSYIPRGVHYTDMPLLMGSCHISLLQPKGGTLYWHATTHRQLSYHSPTDQGGYTIPTCHYSWAVVILLSYRPRGILYIDMPLLIGICHITLLPPKGGTLYWHATIHGQLSSVLRVHNSFFICHTMVMGKIYYYVGTLTQTLNDATQSIHCSVLGALTKDLVFWPYTCVGIKYCVLLYENILWGKGGGLSTKMLHQPSILWFFFSILK